MRFEHFERGTGVGQGGVRVVEVFLAIKLIGRHEVALLHFVEDVLHVHELAARDVEVDARADKLLYEHRYVETVGVETGKVAACKYSLQFVGEVAEVRFVRHVGISYAIHGRGFCRDVNAGVEAQGAFFLRAVGQDLDVAEFYDAVGGNVQPRGFYVEKHDGAVQIEFHS